MDQFNKDPNRHPKNGVPSSDKMASRMAGWQLWARSMATMRQVNAEIADKRNALRKALDD